MSAVIGSLGRARNSSHVHVRSTPPFWIENVHRSSGVCGVGPAESTGKSRVTDWPGGTRAGSASASRRRPRKPRETKLLSVSFFMSVPPCAADSSLAPWHRAHLGARWCASRRFAVTLAQKGGLPEAHVPWVLRQWLLGAASRGGITNSTTARP